MRLLWLYHQNKLHPYVPYTYVLTARSLPQCRWSYPGAYVLISAVYNNRKNPSNCVFCIYLIYFTTSLTHWGRVTHTCVGKLSIIGSDNGLSPNRRQAIIWTNAGILLIGTLGTNVSEISIEIYTLSFRKMHLKMSSGKWRPCCLGLNELTDKRKTVSYPGCIDYSSTRQSIPP